MDEISPGRAICRGFFFGKEAVRRRHDVGIVPYAVQRELVKPSKESSPDRSAGDGLNFRPLSQLR